MTLSYDSITTFIRENIMPTVIDTIFLKRSYLTNRLITKSQNIAYRIFEIMLEFDNTANVQNTAEWAEVALVPTDPFTNARFEPELVTGTLMISKHEELKLDSDQKVENLIKKKIDNLRKSIEKHWIEMFWARTTATNAWNSIETVVGVAALGGIPATGAVPAWWKSHILDLEDARYLDDAQNPDNLTNPNSDVYLLTLLQEGVANASYQTDEDPTVIVVPQYIWDLAEAILNEQKRGNLYNEFAASLGFKALDFRGIPIVAEKKMVAAQEDDTDGRIEYINENLLKITFNPKAKFSVDAFEPIVNMNAKAMKSHVFGNNCIANRGAFARHINIYSPQNYANR